MNKTDQLRERAEKAIKKAKLNDINPESTAELVHELQVYQVELELQNKELRDSQIELSNLYEKYLELFNNAPVGYFTVDKNKVIRTVNNEGAKLLGLEKKRIINRGFSNFILKNSQNDYYNAILNAINQESVQKIELQLLNEKSPFYVQMEIMPIVDKSDEMYLITITDIGKLKKAEEELKKANINLKRSNDELQQFAYVSSHDLQEPLRTIASFSQLLERRYKGQLDSDADEFIDFIVDAAKRMKAQIQDLLEFSRVETKEREFEPVDMNLIANQVIKSLNSSVDECKARIIIDKLPTVIGDARQLQRVFQNLISNAIKFRKPDEPPRIHISAYKSEDGGGMFLVCRIMVLELKNSILTVFSPYSSNYIQETSTKVLE